MLNCGYGHGYSVLELLDAVQRVSGRALDIRARARRAGDIPVMVAAAERIREVLGWTARATTISRRSSRTRSAWEKALMERRACGLTRQAIAVNERFPLPPIISSPNRRL